MSKKILYYVIGIISTLLLISVIFNIKNSSTNNKKLIVTIKTNDTEYKLGLDKDKLIIKPAEPTREGYEFVGWYCNGKEFDFNSRINKSITIEARWKRIGTITSNSNSNSNSNVTSNSNSNVTSNSNSNSNVVSNSNSNVVSNSNSNKVNNSNSNKVSNKISNSNSNKQSNTTSNKTSNKTSNTTSNKPSNTTSNKIAVTSVTLSKNSHSMNIGDNITLSATIKPSNATNKTIIWKSSNTKVVTVSNGKVVAVGGGTANVTATVDGKTATCKVTVIKPETYSYELVDVPGSTTGQVYIYIKNSSGKHVSGTLTITYKNGRSEDVSISSSGYLFPSRAVISSISNVKGN